MDTTNVMNSILLETIPPTKFCNKCLQNKPLNEFGNNKNKPDGKYYYCLVCDRKMHAEWRDSKRVLHAKIPQDILDGGTKICVICKLEKPKKDFCNSGQSVDGKHSSCRKCRSLLTCKWAKENPEKHNKNGREGVARIKSKVFSMYGHVCSICGYSNPLALSLDHVNGGGRQERKKFGAVGPYRKASKEYRPDLYRILCMNCQFIERAKLNNYHKESLV